MKNEKKPKEKIKFNPKIDKIIGDFPKEIMCIPRLSFEHQLGSHLSKHGVK